HRTEVTNYRNPSLPTGMNIPTFIKDDFKHFYTDLFRHALEKENGAAVFTEHAWPLNGCDPCSAPMLTQDELQKLGVWWDNPAWQAFVTRIHARYTPQTFPEDLILKVTKDATPYQARFVMQQPWRAETSCAEASSYWTSVEQRRSREIETLATLTGWKTAD